MEAKIFAFKLFAEVFEDFARFYERTWYFPRQAESEGELRKLKSSVSPKISSSPLSEEAWKARSEMIKNNFAPVNGWGPHTNMT